MKPIYFYLIFFSLIVSFSSCKKVSTGPHSKLILQPDATKGKDAVFSYIVPNNNYGNSESIHLSAQTQNLELNVSRFAVDFDLSSIPAGAKVDSAFLSLYFNKTSMYGSNHNGENDFLIQRITSRWEESNITWKTQPNSTNISQVLVPKSTNPNQDFKNIDVKNIVQDMINDKNNSFGFMLKLRKEEPYRVLLFASSDHPDESLRPKITVYYTKK
ncbi:MAG: DNRLRE domain-containing protein [Bacteroidetes bacterium]|nr:DNRLRE domain-containing protein [Bacteroidota bacterium]